MNNESKVVTDKNDIVKPEWLYDVWDTKDDKGVVQTRELSFCFTGLKMRSGTESFSLNLIMNARKDGKPPSVYVSTMHIPLLQDGKPSGGNLYIKVNFHAQGIGFKGLEDMVQKMIEAGNKRLGCEVGQKALAPAPKPGEPTVTSSQIVGQRLALSEIIERDHN